MRLSNVLAVYAKPTNKEQKSTLEIVNNTLKMYSASYKLIDRDKLSKKLFEGSDLVVAVGGDGTFLRAAQFVGSQLLLGVNADVKNKEGFFMKYNKNDFKIKLKNLLKNKFEIMKLPRLEAHINNKKIDALAVNEFFIGPRKSYHAAKCVLRMGGKSERQKSSGVLVTTPAGSYAWAKACCSKTMPLKSKSYQFVVREPYEGNVYKNYKLKQGILKKNQKIEVVSEMLDGIMIADSVGMEYSLKNGSKASISLSKKYLNVIW